jgi:hypothetical protein
MSCLGVFPPFEEEDDFGFSTNQRRESSGLSHIQATGDTTLTQHVIDVYGLGDATQGRVLPCPGTRNSLGSIERSLH